MLGEVLCGLLDHAEGLRGLLVPCAGVFVHHVGQRVGFVFAVSLRHGLGRFHVVVKRAGAKLGGGLLVGLGGAEDILYGGHVRR